MSYKDQFKVVNKPAIFALGACDLQDSLMVPSIARAYRLNNVCSTSLLSLLTPPGSISLQILDYFHQQKHTSDTNNLLIGEAKKSTIDLWKTTATSQDFLIISFSTEFYTKFYDDKECLTLHPHLRPVPGFDWFNNNILAPSKFHLEFDEEKNLSLQQDLIYDFADIVDKIFQDRVILVKTHLTDKIINGKKTYIEKAAPTSIHNFSNKKSIVGEKSSNYGQRLVDAMIKQFRRTYKHDIPLVSIGDEFVFRDARHRWGPQPFHLHSTSTLMIGAQILEELKKKNLAG
jgi:hypothetical protein